MTFVAVALLGVAVLLIGSALDNSTVIGAAQKIINNQPLDWTGTGTSNGGQTVQHG